MGQPFLFRMIDKAVFDYALIEKGDKILVGASGGKDSTALIEYFANRKKRPQDEFDFTALHISSEITKPLDRGLLSFFDTWNVDYKDVYVNVLERVKSGHKMNCYWCSTQRRTELLHYAISNGYNKIALGHHLDDILETVIMNALEKGELSTMTPRFSYKKYPLTIIRPLCYVPMEKIIEHSISSGYINSTCTCNYQDNSARKAARKKLDFLTDCDSVKKQRLFSALRTIKAEYLP